ncbi:MAG: gamma-glutamylcyclotransferase family protein [Ferrovibrio sp.]
MVYFFYGTLCDADVLKLILGYRPSPRQFRPARLPGWRRKRARGRSYPVLLRATGGWVTGLLFRPARATDAPRLTAYEGPEYITRNLSVRRGQPHLAPRAAPARARVFLPAGSSLPAGFNDWALPRWQRRDKAAFLRSLQDQGPTPCASR